MMISATELQPRVCLDCHKSLGRLKLVSSRPFNNYSWPESLHIDCECGAIYIWSYDETNFNGGIWKRRHLLPLFDDRARIEITKAQIAKHMKNHSAIYNGGEFSYS